MAEDIDIIIKKYRKGKREDLIPLLQEIQEKNGFLSEDAVVKVGGYLSLSTTKIFGLATFYDQFRFFPVGKIHLRICNGTSCFMNGSQAVIDKIKEETGILPGQTTRDGSFSYEVVTCMGGCNNGPVVSVNGTFHTHVSPAAITDMIKKLKLVIGSD